MVREGRGRETAERCWSPGRTAPSRPDRPRCPGCRRTPPRGSRRSAARSSSSTCRSSSRWPRQRRQGWPSRRGERSRPCSVRTASTVASSHRRRGRPAATARRSPPSSGHRFASCCPASRATSLRRSPLHRRCWSARSGPSVRSFSASGTRNGVTLPTHGVGSTPKSGGDLRHTPGVVPKTNGNAVEGLRPSFARAARSAAAAASPTAIPPVFAGPSAIAASDASYFVCRISTCAGRQESLRRGTQRSPQLRLVNRADLRGALSRDRAGSRPRSR